MPILPRKFDWDKEINQTTAKDSFVICRPDEFPLSEIQAIAERALNPKPPTKLFSKKPVPSRSADGDETLIHELKALSGVLYIEEAAIVGCLHLFTWEVARWHLMNKIKPDLDTADTDRIFTSRISVYLQCIVIAQKVGSLLIHEGEALAARQLLRILHHGKSKEFPSVVKLLATVADTSCGDLLPFDFLAEVLRRAEWREKLKDRLAHLGQSRRWADAYSLVDGLQDLSQRPDLPRDVRRCLPDLVTNYPMWASWRPDISRIHAWKASTTPEQRAQLAPVFELEGPDTTPQQRSTLRHSSSGAFPSARSHGTHNNKDILDHLLDLLDHAVRIGPNAINLFIHLTLTNTLSNTTIPPTHEITWHPLHQLSAAFSPGIDSIPSTLLSFLLSLHPSTSPTHRLTTFTTLLPLLTSSPPLQSLFGETNDISIRAPRALSDAQKHLCHLLLLHSQPQPQPQPALLPLGLAILALGRALLSSTWLHDRWKPAFVHMLRGLPSEGEIRSRFIAIQAFQCSPAERQAQMDYLAVSLGASEIALGQQQVMATPPPPPPPAVVLGASGIPLGHQQQQPMTTPPAPPVVIPRAGGTPLGHQQQQPMTTPPPPVVTEDEIWQVELDADRHALRKTLRALLIKGLDKDLGTKCLKAAEAEEHDSFVKGVTGYIAGGSSSSSDQVCVNMARFLAPRVVGRARTGRECWVALCLWMMRRRPRGMLERLGADLSAESWNEWVGCLGKLFGEGHLGEKGGLGFTAERMRQITVWKMSRVGRVHSGSSRSTVSLGY